MLSITRYYRFGTSLFARIFFQNFDASWLGLLDKNPGAIRGLWWTKEISVKCYESKRQAEEEGLIEDARRLLRAVQEPIVKAFEQLGSLLSSSSLEDFKNWKLWSSNGGHNDAMRYKSWRKNTFLDDDDEEPLNMGGYYDIDPAWLDPHSPYYYVPELESTLQDILILALEANFPGSSVHANDTYVETINNLLAVQLNATHPGAAAHVNDTLEETMHNIVSMEVNAANPGGPQQTAGPSTTGQLEDTMRQIQDMELCYAGVKEKCPKKAGASV